MNSHSITLLTQKVQASVLFLMDFLHQWVIFIHRLITSALNFLLNIWRTHQIISQHKNNTSGYILRTSYNLSRVLNNLCILFFRLQVKMRELFVHSNWIWLSCLYLIRNVVRGTMDQNDSDCQLAVYDMRYTVP